jgi:hypothetical protein
MRIKLEGKKYDVVVGSRVTLDDDTKVEVVGELKTVLAVRVINEEEVNNNPIMLIEPKRIVGILEKVIEVLGFIAKLLKIFGL